MGQQQSAPTVVPPTTITNENAVATPAQVKAETDNKSACPMHQNNKPAGHVEGGDESKCPVKRVQKAMGGSSAATAEAPKAAANATAPSESECPVSTKYKNPTVYNVYNQKIDPKNQMPSTANQQPAPGQEVSLSVDRQASTIPKGGTDSTWVYPSPQMFWNALIRKNKVEGAVEEDMESVVRIHNNMNESTWRQVIEWEKLHPVEEEGKEPRLLRFLGRPDELSPKARLKVLAGHATPFDRHDWIVDRGGKEVRYIIDYYHDEAGASRDATPQHMHDFASIKSIKIDVRPALDSFEALFDRVVRMPILEVTGKTNYKPLPFFPDVKTIEAEKKQLAMVQKAWDQIRSTCGQEKELLASCKSEQECANAAIAIQACTARVVCPSIEKDFTAAIKAQPYDAEKTDRMYASMVKCLELFEIDSRKAFEKANK